MFRDYVFSKLPARFVCFDDECMILTADTSEKDALITIESDRIPALCAYCESTDAL